MILLVTDCLEDAIGVAGVSLNRKLSKLRLSGLRIELFASEYSLWLYSFFGVVSSKISTTTTSVDSTKLGSTITAVLYPRSVPPASVLVNVLSKLLRFVSSLKLFYFFLRSFINSDSGISWSSLMKKPGSRPSFDKHSRLAWIYISRDITQQKFWSSKPVLTHCSIKTMTLIAS